MTFLLVVFMSSLGGFSYSLQYEFKTKDLCEQNGKRISKEVDGRFRCLEIKK